MINQWGLDLGFERMGAARLKGESEGAHRFKEWIDKGHAGEMAYLKRGVEKRMYPDLVLSNASSILLFAWDYGKDTLARCKISSPRYSPALARYAWLEDYHSRLGNKLKQLEEKLQANFPTHHFKSYVDTGPVQEKYWASQTSLGWIGKNTNLIHPKEGSFFLLACILTDLELEPDTPQKNHCGGCKSCIDVCPTQAIVAPYALDARRCISYLTIELKGPIPKEFRKGIGTHVFGCDDCQQVCPWNHRARLPEEKLKNIQLEDLLYFLSLSKNEFQSIFKDSPILRSKRRGFLRNVCVVLGNLKDARSLPALAKALEDEEDLIRAHAAWALGQFENGKGHPFLKERQPKEKTDWVKNEIHEALLEKSFSRKNGI